MVVTITLGGYFEIIISAYLTLLSPEKSIDHIDPFIFASFLFGWICIVFVPCVTLHLMLLPLDELAKEKTRERWGMFFLDLDYRSPHKLFYQIVFMGRRVIFVSIAFLLVPFGGLQIVLFNILNMLVFEAFTLTRPLRTKFRNDLETFNEFMIGIIMIICVSFTDFCKDEVHKYNMGWMMLFVMTLILIVSFSLVVYDTSRFIYLALIRYQIPHIYHRFISGPFAYWWTPKKLANPAKTWLAPKP